MKRSSEREPDVPFGQTMRTLRTALGLTQCGLAQQLGVSRQTVATWEAGKRYPKVASLKQIIALGMQRQVFPTGSQRKEIRALWQAAHQKERLDEHWLQTLLGHQRPHLTLMASQHVRQTRPGEQTPAPPVLGPRVDWGEALAASSFYGREQVEARLCQWVLQEHCRLVSVLGMGGIGKSALVVKLMHWLASHFDVVIFRSLRDAPPCEQLLDDCLQVLSSHPLGIVPANLEQRFNLLIESLRQMRVLVVLDNLEALLQEGEATGRFHPDYEGYGRLLRRVGEAGHQSCLLLTSREKLAEVELSRLEGVHAPVRSLHLGGLSAAACEQIFAEQELIGAPLEQAHLAELYAGNPLALKIVAQTITECFGGLIGPFLAEKPMIFGRITDLLDEQYTRLSCLEQIVLHWLAIIREPITLNELLTVLVTSPPQRQIFEAIDGLRRRSLVERGQRQGSFTLQSVVLEYVSTILIEETIREIQQDCLSYLIHYSLEQATAREYVRQTQERLLLAPILASVQNLYRGKNEVEERLLSLLDELREWADYAQGYGPANLIALLRLHRGHLRGIDLSNLMIRGAYLQGIEMQGASLARAQIRDTVFTQALDAIWSVAINRDGTLWAAGSGQGKVWVWEKGGHTLHMVWQAHTDLVVVLAFGPDGSILSSGSLDGTVKLWDMASGALIWTGKQCSSQSLAISPDGSLLASGGQDATVRIWDVQSGTNLQILPHPGHVFAVAWSPDGQMLASGCLDGQVHLWKVHKTASATCVRILSRHIYWVTSLAFAPDGRTVASGSWDHTVKLWEVASGRLLQTLSGHTDKVLRVVWSCDGRTLASCGFDDTIRLWDVERGCYQAVLHGHSADVYGIALAPDDSYLLSGSADGTIRTWEVASGQCTRIIQGYSVSLYDINWSPDGSQIASGDTNAQVVIWDIDNGAPTKVLHGHSWTIAGVAWSPDGQWLASSGWDDTLRLWDAASGTCIKTLQDPNAVLQGIAWNPDGRQLVCGTYQQGMRMWDMTSHHHQWVRQAQKTAFRRVAWSPDGTQVVSGGDDGIVYLWDAVDGTQQQQLLGHHSGVNSVAWSPGGNRLASGGGEGGKGELYVWDVQLKECMRAFVGHPGVIYAVAWSPKGNQLISGSSYGTLCWWDVQSGEFVRAREAHQGTVQSLRVSPDGRKLASCGDDGAINIWDLHSAELLQTLRRDRPYERVNITGVRGLTEAQKATLKVLGMIEGETVPQTTPAR